MLVAATGGQASTVPLAAEVAQAGFSRAIRMEAGRRMVKLGAWLEGGTVRDLTWASASGEGVKRRPLQPRRGRDRGLPKCCRSDAVRQRCYQHVLEASYTFEIRNWSGARDLNPGPHGPELSGVSATERGFEGFEIDWRH